MNRPCGIDVGAKVEVYNVMNSLVKQGQVRYHGISGMPDLGMSADRVIVMRGGEVMAEVDRDSGTFSNQGSEEGSLGVKLDD